MRRRLVILGATGSIGRQALEVVACYPEHFEVVGLSCHSDWQSLSKLAAPHPGSTLAVVSPPPGANLPSSTITGNEANQHLIEVTEPDLVLNAIFGMAGLRPTLTALERGIDVALANKEALVAGGPLVLVARQRGKANLIPVDSEHNALHQLMRGVDPSEVVEVVLTCSGGPFRGKNRQQLAQVSLREALAHPTWQMGSRITINSATLFNKALELVEACYLFGLRPQQIRVLVHPQSLIHGMARLKDGAIYAHLSTPDMRHPIQDALLFPERGWIDFAPLPLEELSSLTFEPVDEKTFPAIELMRQALELGWHGPLILNAANELALDAFIEGKITFLDLLDTPRRALEMATALKPPKPSLAAVEELSRLAKERLEQSLSTG